MRHLIFCILLALLTGTATANTNPKLGIRDKTPDLTALTNATIIQSPNVRHQSATLVIRDGKVLDIGSDVSIPEGARIIDLSGYTIYPGFVDPFTEYGLPKEKDKKSGGSRSEGPVYEGTRVGANAWNDAIHAQKNWVDSFRSDEKSSKEYLKIGFTTVQSAAFDGIFRGRSLTCLLGEGLPNELILSPNSRHFLSFDKGSSKQDYPESLMGSIALIRQTLLDAEWYGKAWSAYRANPEQKAPELNLALAGLAGIGQSPVVFETDDLWSMLRAERLCNEFGLTAVHVGSGYEYARLEQVKATGATLILPLDFPRTPDIKSLGDEVDVSLAQLRHWETAPTNPATLESAGISFAFTTHRLKKKSDLLGNIRKAIKHGLSPGVALTALTTIPAEICGVSDQTGTLSKGKLANFIVCDGDIFDEETTLYSVWVRGRKNELKPLPGADYRGEYSLKFGDLELPLSIKGKITKPSGKVTLGEDNKKKLKNIKVRFDKLFFTLELDTFDIKGALRFSGTMRDNGMAGTCALPDGQMIDWSAIKTGDYTPEEDSTDDKAESVESTTLVARLTYPNKAFGFEERPPEQDILITNCTIWTSESEGILEDADMLVIDGKIAAVGNNLQAPSSALVMDGTGKHLTAGIIDAHSHIAISRGVNEGTHSITSEVRIGDVVNPEHNAIYRQLAGGVTTSHLLHGSANPVGGQLQLIKLRWGATDEGLKFTGAPPTIKFALGENVKQSNWGEKYRTRYPQSRMGVETIIKDGFQAALEYESDWAKYNSLSSGRKKKTIPPQRDLQLEALADVLNSKLFIHCHSYVQSEVLMLMRVAEEFDFVVQCFTHILEGYKVAPEMARHGATASAFSDWWAYKFEVYDAIPYNVALMTEKGVTASINSDDADLARRLNTEAGKSVQYGSMSQVDAIKLCTINSAIQLKVDDRIGSIKVGKDADFVIWNNNPLSLYAKCEQTWIEGRKYFDIETDRQMRLDISKERETLIQKILASPADSKSDKSWGKKKHDPDRLWHCDDIFDVWETVQ